MNFKIVCAYFFIGLLLGCNKERPTDGDTSTEACRTHTVCYNIPIMIGKVFTPRMICTCAPDRQSGD